MSAPNQIEVNKLHKHLRTHNCFHVLESLPGAGSFTFRQTYEYTSTSTKLFLGYRTLSDKSTQVEIWAHLAGDHDDLEIPIIFYDETVLENGERRMWKRSAAGLVRKATDLFPPFCFLHHEPPPRYIWIREMVCAVTLYYFLIAGVSDEALRWMNFRRELERALKYIASRTEYQRWAQDKDEKKTQEMLNANLGQSVQSSQLEGNNILPGTIAVCPQGSAVPIRQDTALLGLIHNLRDTSKLRVLDAIPKTPVYISRQSIYTKDFGFRMLIGKCASQSHSSHGFFYVWVYLETKRWRNDTFRTMKIRAHDSSGHLQGRFSLDKLDGYSLIEPFRSMQDNDASAQKQGEDVHTLIYYYFMVAKNEGIIDNPGLSIGTDYAQKFVNMCKVFAKGSNRQKNIPEVAADDGSTNVASKFLKPARAIKSAASASTVREDGHLEGFITVHELDGQTEGPVPSRTLTEPQMNQMGIGHDRQDSVANFTTSESPSASGKSFMVGQRAQSQERVSSSKQTEKSFKEGRKDFGETPIMSSDNQETSQNRLVAGDEQQTHPRVTIPVKQYFEMVQSRKRSKAKDSERHALPTNTRRDSMQGKSSTGERNASQDRRASGGGGSTKPVSLEQAGTMISDASKSHTTAEGYPNLQSTSRTKEAEKKTYPWRRTVSPWPQREVKLDANFLIELGKKQGSSSKLSNPGGTTVEQPGRKPYLAKCVVPPWALREDWSKFKILPPWGKPSHRLTTDSELQHGEFSAGEAEALTQSSSYTTDIHKKRKAERAAAEGCVRKNLGIGSPCLRRVAFQAPEGSGHADTGKNV